MARRRQVSAEEQALWRSVTRGVSPLRPGHNAAAAPSPDPHAPQTKPAAAEPIATVGAKPGASRASHKRAEPPATPALAPLDRRATQRLARGTSTIDARLDLHGRSQAQAHAALLRFLHTAQGRGAKTVLVITGKGSGGERGVLRRQVPLWLALPEFRALVVGFAPAAIAHGGDGALYVRLRRGRRSTG
ncbi:MAG: Smr/MutS family protein [Hyphomicrobiales bacterium]|nr:Smr/MutS family protein [Hyphomicrobiales bacterium]